MRAAVYCGTRNLYPDMVTAAKSLIHNSNVEKVFFLIEDDTFPEPLPSIVETINVSNQSYFRLDGPNYSNRWTYMVLLKLAMHRIFPNLDKILCLDVDTIVVSDVSALWDMPLKSYYLAGVKEPAKTTSDRLYINAGVMMLNLRELRDSFKGDEMISAVNRKRYVYCEQDCIVERCQGGILELPEEYNACEFMKFSGEPKIVHYAAVKNWQKNTKAKWHQQLTKYRKMSWEDVLHEHSNSSSDL